MIVRDAAKFAGVGMGAAKRWSVGDLPRSCTGRPGARVESGATMPERPEGEPE